MMRRITLHIPFNMTPDYRAHHDFSVIFWHNILIKLKFLIITYRELQINQGFPVFYLEQFFLPLTARSNNSEDQHENVTHI